MADLFKWIGMGRAPSGVKESQANARIASADTPDNKGVVYEEPNTFTASIFGGLSPRSQDPPPTPRAPVTMSSDPNGDKHPATAGTKDVGELQEKLESLGKRIRKLEASNKRLEDANTDLKSRLETVQEAAGEGTAGAGAGAGGHDRELGGPKEPAEGRAKQEEKKQTCMQKCMNPVAFFWGGPMMAVSDDNPWSYFERFAGGTTTAHGINRVFDDDAGIVRRIFWFCAFAGGCYGAYFFVGGTITDFLGMNVITVLTEGTHQGAMPMMSLCSLSPVQCSCEAFYEPEIIKDHFEKVLPFICRETLVFKDTSPDTIDATGKITAYSTLEDILNFVDIPKTKAKLNSSSIQNLNCDNVPADGINKDWIKAKIISGTFTRADLYEYAGHTRRTQIVKDCTLTDSTVGSPTFGKKISCNGDDFWGEQFMDEARGVCNVFNPCFGFPVGAKCETDADCDTDLNRDALTGEAIKLPQNAHIPGGTCNAKGVCECKACVAGSNCKLAQQSKPGKGRGVRFVVMAAVDVTAAINQAQTSQWSAGVWMHLHTQFDQGMLNHGFNVGPGAVLEALIGKDKHHEYRGYPFTNCSTSFNIDPDHCQANCLRRAQTLECCTKADGKTPYVPSVIKGKFQYPINFTKPNGSIKRMANPAMAMDDCRMQDPAVKKCMAEQETRYQDGEICLPGSFGTEEAYKFLIFQGKKSNSYLDDKDTNNDGISDEEEQSDKMEKHCVWKKDQLGDGNELLLGKSCETDGDCKTSLGNLGVAGKCKKAYRAYCPMRCVSEHFKVVSSTSNPMSKGTEEFIALRELSTTTQVQQLTGQSTTLKKFKPRCASDNQVCTSDANGTQVCTGGDTPECFTLKEATDFVKGNYAIVSFEYADFSEANFAKQEAVSIPTIVGAVGGNLGLFMGFSIMTILEWFEMGLFFLLSLPLILTGGRLNLLPFCVRPAPKDEDEVDTATDQVHVKEQ